MSAFDSVDVNEVILDSDSPGPEPQLESKKVIDTTVAINPTSVIRL